MLQVVINRSSTNVPLRCVASGIENSIVVHRPREYAIEDHFEIPRLCWKVFWKRKQIRSCEIGAATLATWWHFSYNAQKEPALPWTRVLVARTLGNEPFAVLRDVDYFRVRIPPPSTVSTLQKHGKRRYSRPKRLPRERRYTASVDCGQKKTARARTNAS